MKEAFVTGATGFLGINLVKRLIKEGWEVTTFSLPGSDNKYLQAFDVNVIEGDLNNFEKLAEAIPTGVDVVFHIAGNTSMWKKYADKQYQDNVIGTRNIVKASLRKAAKKLIYTSSISAYGYHDGHIDEITHSNAMDCHMNYNLTKYLAEKEVRKGVERGLFSVIVNPINIIGPYDVNNWTRQFIQPIYNNRLVAVPPGRAMWCYVDDIVDAHINASKYGRCGENYLLGGVEASFLEVVQAVQKQLGKEVTSKVYSRYLLKFLSIVMNLKSLIDKKEPILTFSKYKRAVGNITCDYGKAKAELNYQTTPLNEMIEATCQWLITEDLL